MCTRAERETSKCVMKFRGGANSFLALDRFFYYFSVDGVARNCYTSYSVVKDKNGILLRDCSSCAVKFSITVWNSLALIDMQVRIVLIEVIVI